QLMTRELTPLSLRAALPIFTPAMRESDDDCLRRATVFVDTEEALQKSGDLLEPIKSGAFARERTAATLAQLCRGEHGGRNEADEDRKSTRLNSSHVKISYAV